MKQQIDSILAVAHISLFNYSGKNILRLIKLILPVILLLIAGCGEVKMTSSGRTDEILIDGDISDWQGHLLPVDDKPVSVGFQHDDQFFYGCLVTSDPMTQRKILIRGLVLWISEEPAQTPALGIKYPIGVMASGVNPGELMRKGYRNNAQNMAMIYEMTLNDLEIQSPEDTEFRSMTIRKLAGSGLEISTDLKNGQWVYELKVPLKADEGFAYSVGGIEAKQIKLKAENPEIDMSAMMVRGRGAGMHAASGGGRGRGGRGMRGGGGMGGPPGGGQRGSTESFKVAFSVELSQ